MIRLVKLTKERSWILLQHYQKVMKELREDNDLKQEAVANYLNITRQQYSLYETGKRDLPIELLKSLCSYYGISADYILGLPKGLKWMR